MYNYVYFQSNEPGTATVDWGDGNIETFSFRKRSETLYTCGWRSLAYENPKPSQDWGWGNDLETGEVIIPYENHHYSDDDITKERKIVITFTNEIYAVTSQQIKQFSFPILETPSLESLAIAYTINVPEIPYDRITKLKKLRVFNIGEIGFRLEYIPQAFFEMENLESISFNNCLNLTNPDSSNLRSIGQLKKLTTANLLDCYVSKYVKEFNDLPNLTNLTISSANNAYPDFSEVTAIKENLTTFNWFGSGWFTSRTNWGESATGKGLGKIGYLDATYNASMNLSYMPDYIKDEMRGLSQIGIWNSIQTQARADLFVDTFYDYVLGWDKINMTSTATDGLRNQFYNMRISAYNGTYPYNSYRPSGILQAPDGFVLGSNNGNPTTPMEKIYVLQQNYKQVWSLRPA